MGVWIPVATDTVTRASQTPQRLTYGADVVAKRYEVRGRRLTNFSDSSKIAELLQWEALRGIAPSTVTYPKTTMVAMRALASNNLNSNTRARLNVYATRKLPVYNDFTETWSAGTPTRNPVWAFCDVFRSTYGGRLAEEYLDLDALVALAATYDEREDYFDGTFDTSLTVWEAAKAVARVGRAVPIPQGSRITMIRDEPQTLPAGMFNAENMEANTFREELDIFKFGDFDSLLVEYTDPLTWKPVEILCQLPGDFAENPDTLKLFGVTDRAQAYREGMFILATRRYQKIQYSWRTGLEGHIPTYLDLVGFHNDSFAAPMSGFVLGYDSGTNTATLSEKVSFAPGYSHAVLFRGADGSAMGAAIAATAGASANQIVLAEDPPEALNFNPDEMPSLFFFGIADFTVLKGKVAGIHPIDESTVEMRVVNYDPRVYEFDSSPVPPLVAGIVTPKDPDAPTVENLIVSNIPDQTDRVILTWPPSRGAVQFIIQKTHDLPVDGSSKWDEVTRVPGGQTSFETLALPSEVVYRIYALSRGGFRSSARLSLAAEIGFGGVPVAPVGNPYVETDTLSLDVSWQAAPDALGHTVKVYKAGDATLLRSVDLENAEGLAYSYTSAFMLADTAAIPTASARSFDFKIYAFSSGGDSATFATITATNPAPPVITSPATTPTGGTNYDFTWDALPVIPADFTFYRVYASATPGFTPSGANQVYQGTSPTVNLSRPATTYWKVAAFDVWASGHTDANFTAEQTLTV